MAIGQKTVIIYSGGLDSTVLLYMYWTLGHKVHALGVNYGQRHEKELNSAFEITRLSGIPYKLADMRGVTHLLAGNSQTDPSVPVPEGHYAEESMKQTVVPNRNMMMLSVAAAWAIAMKAKLLAYGAHSGDHAIYPDCRSPFANAMGDVLKQTDWHQLDFAAPFLDITKAEIVRLGAEFGVPFGLTWSCYKGGELHCGKCGTCVERREAFSLAGLADPTKYE